jgi:hypothetical protein
MASSNLHSTPPLLLNNDDLTAPYARAVDAARWARIDRWEQTLIQSGDGESVWPPMTRGEWINNVLNDLLNVCAKHGQEVEHTQTLRDDLFDMVRAQSRI